jgi:putative addiction module antidote
MEVAMPKIMKMGNSLGVTISKECLEQLGLAQGDEVEIRVRGSILEVVPVVRRMKLRPSVQAAYDEALTKFGPAFERLAK